MSKSLTVQCLQNVRALFERAERQQLNVKTEDDNLGQ